MKLYTHPFRKGVESLLERHFAPEITKDFVLEFEANMFSRDSVHIWNQVKDENLIMEVRYKKDDGTFEYICDVKSWMSKKATEAHLLRYITDCYKAGKIGQNWVEEDGRLTVRLNDAVLSGELQTKAPNDVTEYNQLMKDLGRKDV